MGLTVAASLGLTVRLLGRGDTVAEGVGDGTPLALGDGVGRRRLAVALDLEGVAARRRIDARLWALEEIRSSSSLREA